MKNRKKIKETKSPYKIAKELGVSPQAVYKKITEEFINELNNHIQHNEEGKYLLDDVAEKELKKMFSPVEQPVKQPIDEQVNQPLLNQLMSENNFLRQRIELLETDLRTEREHSREQSDKIAVLADQAQKLQLANMNSLDKPLISDSLDSKKKSFWDRFKRNTDENT